MTIPQSFAEAFTRVKELVDIFKENEPVYLGPRYGEADARKDFIDKFWIALGWDVNHEQQTDPYKQDVKVERGVATSEFRKRADYAFLAENFRDVRFFVEAKKPHAGIETPLFYFQTIRYGWNSHVPISVLHDFEEMRVLDCRYKPDINTALGHSVLKYHYTDYANAQSFRTIYHLFSREAVSNGSIQEFAKGLPKISRKRAARGVAPDQHQSIDESFLQELDDFREELARAYKRKNPDLDSAALTEVTQRTLDRLVFMRFLEDKLIESDPLIEDLHKKGKSWENFIATSRRLDRIYNGIIFKEHSLLDGDKFNADERVFDKISKSLSHRESPYDFNAIPIHILGSIYERFLGKVIVATAKQARIEDKPEVRKAGGVYYTPEYIVHYIVENTVGNLIEGKTPAQIQEMRFADIACGSGSFLLGVYDTLLRYHAAYYNKTKKNREIGLKAGCIPKTDGTLQLSLLQKRQILINNIYGVDIDPQAVEVAQLSLYLKLLEDENIASAKAQQRALHAALLPSLSNNIVCGNSLIERDPSEGQLFETSVERDLNPMNFEVSFPQVRNGFDAIVGNPPYIRIQTLQETNPKSVEYFSKKYSAASKGNYDIYVVFVERALSLLNEQGKLGYILPHKFFNAKYGEPLRNHLSEGMNLSKIVYFGDQQVFVGATTYTCLVFLNRVPSKQFRFVKVQDLNVWRETGVASEGNILTSQAGANEWNFNVGKGASLFEKLAAMPVKLEGVADRIFQGLVTGADPVFILRNVGGGRYYSDASKQEHKLEQDLMHPLCKGSVNLRRYHISEITKSILFPYKLVKDKAELLTTRELSQEYPNAWTYLQSTRPILESRERGKWKHERWYAFGRSQNLSEMEQLKLLTPSIANHASFTVDREGFYYFVGSGGGGGGGYGVTLKDGQVSYEYVLGLLNSKLLDAYLKSFSSPFQHGYYAYNRQYIERLPIRTIDFSNGLDKVRHDQIVQLVDQMLEAKKHLASAHTERDKTFYENKCATLDRQNRPACL